MGHVCRRTDQRLNTSKAYGVTDEAKRVEERYAIEIGSQLKGNHCTEAARLPVDWPPAFRLWLFLTALFWESRLLVLGLGSGLFLLVGFVLYGSFNKAMQRPEQLFSASIAELQEDLRHLKAEDAAAE